MIRHDQQTLEFEPLLCVRRDRAPKEVSSELWSAIWTAGGVCWLCVAVIGILWAWRISGSISGTVQGGAYFVGSNARLLHHGLLFLLAAPAYRLGLGLGWPDTAFRRAQVVVVNVVLALLVVRMAPFVLVLSTALVEGTHDDMSIELHSWIPMRATGAQWMMLLRFWMPAYALGLIAVALVHTARSSHRDSMRLAQLSAQLATARMAALSAQLHPHFLFNSLNAIAGLITDNPPQAVKVVARLGDFLRFALESAKKPWTQVEIEVSGVESYLAVQQSRFRGRLRVRVTVDPQASAALMPALLIQPIVENAIEHGLSNPDESLEVAITIRRMEDRLIIAVANSTPRLAKPLSHASYGDGLRNVSARLHAAYANDASVTVGPDTVQGTCAEVNIPMTFQQPAAHMS
jgi:two-component system, LytTR family, sensor kinase